MFVQIYKSITHKNMWKKFLAVMAIVGMFSTSASALTGGAPYADSSSDAYISGLTVAPMTFSPVKGEKATVSFTLLKNADLYAYAVDPSYNVYEIKGTVIAPVATTAGSVSYTWDGKKADGTVLANGTYIVKVFAFVNGNVASSQSVTDVTIASTSTGGVVDGTIIKGLELNPSSTWDPTDEVLDIDYELVQSVKKVTITASKGAKTVEITEDKYADDDDYTETWDGTEDDGDYVKEGVWTITVAVELADGTTESLSSSVEVKYEEPTIVESFVTKDEFDPSEDESTNLVFKVDSESVVTVEVYNGSKREATLVDGETVAKNKWYAVNWDGIDSKGYEVDNGTNWEFRITAENSVEDKVADKSAVKFSVQADEVSDNKSNVTNDTTAPVIFDDNADYAVTLAYTIDEDADMYAAIYEGQSTSGKAEITLLDYASQNAGDHTIDWNVTDSKGKTLKDGIYSYKIISKTSGNHKETEVGTFVVGNAGDFLGEKEPVEPPVSADCGGYWDTYNLYDADLCNAITWVTSAGIFNGYDDGSFGVYRNINRAEVLKVTLWAFPNAVILPGDGYNQGFWDLDGDNWYMPYVRTAKFYGMMQGYPDGSAGLTKNINRVEFLKFVLEASKSFAGYTTPTYYYSYYADVDVNDANQAWYKDYAGTAYDYNLFDANYNYSTGETFLTPGALVTRGEVAKLLYRMNNYGLLDGNFYGFY